MKTNGKLNLLAAGTLAVALASPAALAASANDRNSDIWSEASLTTTYTLNRHLNPFDIDVDVHDGVATLKGTVESDVERDLAEELALGVDGVHKVDNQLRVEPENTQAERPHEHDFLDTVKDANITAKVKSQLLWNRSTHGLDIDVDTRDRVVTLNGDVASDAEAQLAAKIAENTEGVTEVHNRLKVNGKDALVTEQVKQKAREVKREVTDSWITTKVKSSLVFDRDFSDGDIDVDTHQGVVHLRGTVDSQRQKEEAISIARGIRGVKDVKADLVVRGAT